MPRGRAGDDHGEMAGLDVGAKYGKDRTLGNVLQFDRILEVVEEENRVQQFPSGREREGKCVRQGGQAIPLLRVPTVSGQVIPAFHVPASGKRIA